MISATINEVEIVEDPEEQKRLEAQADAELAEALEFDGQTTPDVDA